MTININKLDKDALEILGKQIRSEFDKNEALRLPTETEWLQSLRQMAGVYDPEIAVKLTIEEARIYPNVTRGKVIPLIAKLAQHLFPEKEKNWDISPSPIPSVSQETLDYIVNELQANYRDKNGVPIPLTQEVIEKAVKEVTAERTDKMKVVMNDQLLEDGYADTGREVLKSGVWYGTGILKGALSKPYQSSRITQDPVTGQWVQNTEDLYRPSGEAASIWSFYPDMSATDLSQCSFVDILHRKTRHEVRKLSKREDFFSDTIKEYLKSKPDGNYKMRSWETLTQAIGTGTPQTTDANSYEVIERHCYIDGAKLAELGIIEEDDKAEHFCEVWLLDDTIIKIHEWAPDLYTSLSDIFHLFYYTKDETSIFGKGLPKILRYAQLGVAACDRGALNNAAWIAGPVGEVNATLLELDQAENAGVVHPGKFYIRTMKGQEANLNVLKFYSVDARITDLLNLKNDLKHQGDADSSLPSSLFGGASGAEETAKGMSIKYANMLDFVKDIIKSFDKAHKSFITTVYKWNMKYNPDESLKGDMQISTIGSSAALLQSAAFESIAFFLQSLPPEGRKRVKWGEFTKESTKLMFPDPDKFIMTEEEYQQSEAQQQAMMEAQSKAQEQLAMAKVGKDRASAAHTEAKIVKLRSTLPHDVDRVAIENEAKRLGNTTEQVNLAKADQELTRGVQGEGRPQ